MKYFKHPETFEVFAYESDGSQDAFIKDGLVAMTEYEVAEHLIPKIDPVSAEISWREEELSIIADQLLRIEDGDPTALPGTGRQWRDYRIQLRAWAEGADHFPDAAYRPARPVAA